MRLNWDGTFLGVFPRTIIVGISETDKNTYWKLMFDEDTVICISRKTKDAFPCVADELKTIFGLKKIGTHTIRIGKTLYHLSRPRMAADNITIVEEIALNDTGISADSNPTFTKQVQEILCFRDILGIVGAPEGRIIVRFDYGKLPFPLSSRELKTHLLQPKNPILSRAMLTKWFGDTTVAEVLMRIMHIDLDEIKADYTSIYSRYQRQIDEIICRVDTNFVWYTNCIMSRISSHLLTL